MKIIHFANHNFKMHFVEIIISSSTICVDLDFSFNFSLCSLFFFRRRTIIFHQDFSCALHLHDVTMIRTWKESNYFQRFKIVVESISCLLFSLFVQLHGVFLFILDKTKLANEREKEKNADLNCSLQITG